MMKAASSAPPCLTVRSPASGTLTLDIAGNGYFNHTKGTSNTVSNLLCNKASDHVQGLANVTLGTMTNCTGF